jgi:hypothetical protein
MFMSPLVSEKSRKALLLHLKTLFNLTMAWSSLSTSSVIVSSDARFAANDWLYVVSWPCMTLSDYDELLVCRYDLQVGLWPNLFKTHQVFFDYLPRVCIRPNPLFFEIDFEKELLILNFSRNPSSVVVNDWLFSILSTLIPAEQVRKVEK